MNGDVLRTKTGRRYLIVEVNGKRLDCIVLDPTAIVRGTVFDWSWHSRGPLLANQAPVDNRRKKRKHGLALD